MNKYFVTTSGLRTITRKQEFVTTAFDTYHQTLINSIDWLIAEVTLTVDYFNKHYKHSSPLKVTSWQHDEFSHCIRVEADNTSNWRYDLIVRKVIREFPTTHKTEYNETKH